MPDEGDPAQLAMAGINPLTAYLALNKYVDLRPGQWFGQNLENSGVGREQLEQTCTELAALVPDGVLRAEVEAT